MPLLARTLALAGLFGCYRATPPQSTGGNSVGPYYTDSARPVDPAALRQRLLEVSAGRMNLWRLIEPRAGLIHINTHEAAYVDDAEMIEERLCGAALGRFIGELQLLHFERVIRERADAGRLSCEAATCVLASIGEGSPNYALTFTRDGKRLAEIVVTDTGGTTDTWLDEQDAFVKDARKRQRSTTCPQTLRPE